MSFYKLVDESVADWFGDDRGALYGFAEDLAACHMRRHVNVLARREVLGDEG